VVFQWDSTKAATNLRKHNVDFHEAATVLKDVLSMTYPDIDHSNYERRYVTIGISDRKRILVVAHADERGSIRIISARKATSHERRFYEES
jgi:uncharacterized DUF497 family protein